MNQSRHLAFFCIVPKEGLNMAKVLKNKELGYQQQLDLLSPTFSWQLPHLCSTSLQEFRQRQQAPVHRKGSNTKHHAFDAHPLLYSIYVIPNLLHRGQLIITGMRE